MSWLATGIIVANVAVGGAIFAGREQRKAAGEASDRQAGLRRRTKREEAANRKRSDLITSMRALRAGGATGTSGGRRTRSTILTSPSGVVGDTSTRKTLLGL